MMGPALLHTYALEFPLPSSPFIRPVSRRGTAIDHTGIERWSRRASHVTRNFDRRVYQGSPVPGPISNPIVESNPEEA